MEFKLMLCLRLCGWLVIDYKSMTLRGLLEYLKEKFEVDAT